MDNFNSQRNNTKNRDFTKIDNSIYDNSSSVMFSLQTSDIDPTFKVWLLYIKLSQIIRVLLLFT